MAEPGIFLYQDKFGKTQPRILMLNWKITDAVTVVSLPIGPPVLVTFGAISAQSTIDNFLGTTSEFNYLAFDATSMGTDAMGVIVNMAGQAARLDGFSVRAYSGTGGATVYAAGAYNNGITNTTLETACALGANGNIAAKVAFSQSGSFDALTSGFIEMVLYWSAIK
jgi:hypothetical protein